MVTRQDWEAAILRPRIQRGRSRNEQLYEECRIPVDYRIPSRLPRAPLSTVVNMSIFYM